MRRLTCERKLCNAKDGPPKCRHCGAVMKIVRRSKRYCDGKCRIAAMRQLTIRDNEASKTAARVEVADKAAKGLAFVLDRQARGRKWFRSNCADELEAYGLPGNSVVAAAVLGISVDVLHRRLRNGTDLLAPLCRSRRVNRESDVPLVVPSAKVLAQIKIHPTSNDITMRRVKAAAADEPEMEV